MQLKLRTMMFWIDDAPAPCSAPSDVLAAFRTTCADAALLATIDTKVVASSESLYLLMVSLSNE